MKPQLRFAAQVGLVGFAAYFVAVAFMRQMDDYRSWRSERDLQIYGCGYTHARGLSLRECRQFITYLLPRRLS